MRVWIPQSIKGEGLHWERRHCILGRGLKYVARSWDVSCFHELGACSGHKLSPCSNFVAGGCGKASEESSYFWSRA